MSDRGKRDPFLEQAREDAEGSEVIDSPESGADLERQREDAEGVEVFEDPDATLPARAAKEGPTGEEIMTGDSVGLSREDEEGREEQSE
jgi:hypothetical protein